MEYVRPYDGYTEAQFVTIVTFLRRSIRATHDSDAEGIFGPDAWTTIDRSPGLRVRMWATQDHTAWSVLLPGQRESSERESSE